MQTDGGSFIHWNNVTNAPTFGSPTWLDPVQARVVGFGTSLPDPSGFGPDDVFANTTDDMYYVHDGAS
jgi:hypothetical protein